MHRDGDNETDQAAGNCMDKVVIHRSPHVMWPLFFIPADIKLGSQRPYFFVSVTYHIYVFIYNIKLFEILFRENTYKKNH